MVKIKRGIQILFLIGGLFSIFSVACSATHLATHLDTHLDTKDNIEINFDSMFPQTPFTQVLHACIQVLQDFQDLYHTKSWCKLQDLNLFTDILIGKLFRIKMDLAKIKCQRPVYHKEDMVFLEELCNKIVYEYKMTCSALQHKPKCGYVSVLVQEIKSKLNKF